jgi:hypothetical protein
MTTFFTKGKATVHRWGLFAVASRPWTYERHGDTTNVVRLINNVHKSPIIVVFVVKHNDVSAYIFLNKFTNLLLTNCIKEAQVPLATVSSPGFSAEKSNLIDAL